MTKIALITGASVGIGRAIALDLAKMGLDVILLARREEKLLSLKAEIEQQAKVQVNIIACDINHHQQLASEVSQYASSIDVLVNNAGLALGIGPADTSNWQDWQTMIETNCLSLAYLTRLILPKMVEKNQGHIINMGSIAGNYAYKGSNVYGASKAFVDQFSINLRADLLGTAVRVCNIMPGLLGETEFSLVRFHGNAQTAEKVYQDYAPLQPEDVANTVSWVLAQPAHVNVNRVEIMPTCQAPSALGLHPKHQNRE